jgi:hypothetical protein
VARTEARILVSIWNDPDFRALTPSAQWAYMFLLSQQDLAHTGVIPLRVRRWAQAADGMTIEAIREALRLLESARFIVADRDTEELLVRSFIRRDKVFKQPQVFRAAADALPLVTSHILRSALADELARVDAEEEMVPSSRDILAEMRAALPHPAGQGAAHPANEAARTSPGVRGVVTEVEMVSPNPVPREPRTPEPRHASSTRGPRARARAGTRAKTAPAADESDFDRFWATYPRREAKDRARKAWAKAIARADPETVIAGAARFRDDPEREAKYTPHPASWLNAGRWTDEPLPRGSPNGQREVNGLMLNPTTIADLEREQRLAALDAQRTTSAQLALEGPAP